MGSLIETLNSPSAQVATRLVIVALLLLLVYVQFYKKERLIPLSYSAGADQRSMMQEFSGTNQRPYETGYNAQVLDAFPFPDESPQQLALAKANEHFRSGRDVPPSQTSEEILAAQIYREHFSPDDIVKSEIQMARDYTA